MDKRDPGEERGQEQEGGVARIYVTGQPGSGKSTLVQRIVEYVESRGCRVAGLYAPEVRVRGRRIGFTLVDVSTGRSTWLARADVPGRFKVGRYTVIEDADRFAWEILKEAIHGNADLVVLDEIGPMELRLPLFRKAILMLLEAPVNQLAVFHRRLSQTHPDIYRLIRRGSVYRIERDNWDTVYKEVSRELEEKLECLQYTQ